MKNLKRVLSLALSSIMLVGMMAVGASAADFTDAESIKHEDAVNTLVALKIVNGKPDGSFDPEGDVTRAEMAKMIAVAMNGGNEANTGVKAVPSFTDIKDTWAEGYIEYCYDLKIISGRGDGTFDPTGKVTGLEATKMVLTALKYDSVAYGLTGAQWAANTDELARAADPSLYETLEGVIMNTPASRDVAAQLIWNGLQNNTRKIDPQTGKTNGDVTWGYSDSGNTLLKERYNAEIVTGTYEGNSDTLDIDDGFIQVDGNAFPSTMGIENIGEQVKVVFKDGSGSGAKTGKPDKRDTIYGVFNTGKTEVYNVLTKDLGDAESATKIKFSGSKYDIANSGTAESPVYKINVVTNLIGSGELKEANYFNTTKKETGLDQIKFVCNEDGQVVSAYITEVGVGKVTNVTSSKITVNGLGTVVIADNDVYSGAKKDDVVTFTKIYNDKVADAFITIGKTETVEGKVSGFKTTENIVVGGKTYKTLKGAYNNVQGSTAYTPTNGDEVKLYLVEDLVVFAEAINEAGGNYAVVIDTSGDSIGGVLSSLRAQVLLADGTDEIVTIHKDSKSSGSTALTVSDLSTPGTLVEYTSLTNGVLKIKQVINSKSSAIAQNSTIWDATAKTLQTNSGAKVATTSAPLFVKIGSDFYVYNLRSLGDVKNALETSVQTNSVVDGGKVVVGYVELKKKPAGTSSDVLYGVIASLEGTFEAPNGDNMSLYKVAVDGETINVYTNDTLAAGKLVTFERTADDCYDADEVKVIVTAADTAISEWTLAALTDGTDGDLLAYMAATVNHGESEDNVAFTGTETTVALGKNVTVVYLNCEDKEPGDDVGYVPFDPAKGYANAVFHTEDGAVDVIIIETSGNVNLATGDCSDGVTTNFGTKTVVTE